jgi:hypothetical protein
MADIARIKGNIAKMIAQNAPETDIDAYVASEGVTLDELRKPSAPAADKYQQAAVEERDALKAKGVDTNAGMARRFIQGLTFNTADEALAGLSTPLEMIKRGTFSPREGYNYAKAREDLVMDDARKNTGALGTAAEIAGGVGTGLGAARAGLSFARGLAPEAGLLSRSLASAGDSAAFGALAGAGEGNSLKERFNSALLGGAVGGVLGGAAPAAISLGSAALSPVISNIRARLNPEGFARSQVARGVSESGMTPAQIADEVRAAAGEGQGMFTAADAMGNAGQRLLATTARAPGQARTDVVNFLDNRQAGQGRRISNALAEGFESPQTAAQTEARLTAQRTADANVNYDQARSLTGAVDVTPAIAEIDRTLSPGVTGLFRPASGIADDSIEGTLRRARSLLTDDRSQVSRFEEAFRAKTELDNMIDNARPTMQRVLIPVRNALDRQLERASGPYAAARDQFRQQSQVIDAVAPGRDAAMRGRSEDVIPRFQALRPDQQAAFRTGYVDPLIESTQGAPFGANKARPLINDAFADESAAIAPGAPLMQRRIGRENTMFQTRNAATGNSKTAENLADDAAMGVDPTLIGQVLSGNWSGALRSVLASGGNALSGNTPAVRQAVADILMTRGSNVNAAQFQRMIDETIQRIQRVQQMARSIGRGAAGGLAVATPSQNRR